MNAVVTKSAARLASKESRDFVREHGSVRNMGHFDTPRRNGELEGRARGTWAAWDITSSLDHFGGALG
jgi:hypothetical protein